MTVGIVANDAGGAEMVSSFARRFYPDHRWMATGPAEAIFRRKLGAAQAHDLDVLLRDADWLLTGTSGEALLEWEAIGVAREMGVRCVSMLDHWTNYSARFLRAGVVHLPDEVWVTDAFAERLSERLIPDVAVRRVDNVYLEETVERIASLRSADVGANSKLTVLYVTERFPERPHPGGEEIFGPEVSRSALRFFLARLDEIDPVRDVGSVVIRPHPRESDEELLWAEAIDPRVRVSRDLSLEEQIAAADMVVGVSSMAMVIALAAGCRTISSVPPGSGDIPLPFPEIEYLRDLTTVDRPARRGDPQAGRPDRQPEVEA